MDAARSKNQEERGSEARTLGDLLYANKAKIRVTESDWVGLIQSIASGDQLALHSLYEQLHRIVFTLIVRITNNRETAEELTVDVFHDVWRRAPAYNPAGGSVVGWIMNQARSRAIDRLRFDQRKKRINSYGDEPRTTSPVNDPHQAWQLKEQNNLLRNALQSLTLEERHAIETAFFSELSYRETAEELNQPVGTVKTRIRSGLAKLREVLGQGLRSV